MAKKVLILTIQVPAHTKIPTVLSPKQTNKKLSKTPPYYANPRSIHGNIHI